MKCRNVCRQLLAMHTHLVDLEDGRVTHIYVPFVAFSLIYCVESGTCILQLQYSVERTVCHCVLQTDVVLFLTQPWRELLVQRLGSWTWEWVNRGPGLDRSGSGLVI